MSLKIKNNINSELTIAHNDGAQAVTVSSDELSRVKTIDTIAGLRSISNPPPTVWVSGYHTKGDGAFGSNIFEWDSASTDADNGGTIIKLDSVVTGRYKLRYSGSVNVKWFGADNTGVTDSTAILQTLFTYMSTTNDTEVVFEDGTYSISPLAAETSAYSYASAIVLKGIDSLKIHSNGSTVIKAGITTSGGAANFALFRIEECNNIEMCNLEFDGDYSNHTGDAGSRSGGILISTFDRVDNSIDLSPSSNIYIHNIECNDIGGFVQVLRRSETLYPQQVYVQGLRVEYNLGHDAALANNTIGVNYTRDITIKHNRFTNTAVSSSTDSNIPYPSMMCDLSRGSRNAIVSNNTGSNFVFGMKCESQGSLGVGLNEIRTSSNITFDSNELYNIGNPYFETVGTGASAGATYGIKLNGNSVVCTNNIVTSITEITASLYTGITVFNDLFTSSNYLIDNNTISGSEYGISHGDITEISANRTIISNNKLSLLKTVGVACGGNVNVLMNEFLSCATYAVVINYAYNTIIKSNDIIDSGVDQAIIQAETGAVGYFEILDNNIQDSRGASAITNGYKLNCVASQEYNINTGYYAGLQGDVFFGNYVGSTFNNGDTFFSLIGNPNSASILYAYNVSSLSIQPGNLLRVTFIRDRPSSESPINLTEYNIINRRWQPWTAGTNYIDFRYIDSTTGAVQTLPTAINISYLVNKA